MCATPLEPRFVKIQNALFERAHAQPSELKSTAVKFKTSGGIKSHHYYVHPEMMNLPIYECDYLSNLGPEQMQVLTAYYLAASYQYTASRELDSVKTNMCLTTKLFDVLSDEYMVLFQETFEEMDHIYTFRSFYETILGDLTDRYPFGQRRNVLLTVEGSKNGKKSQNAATQVLDGAPSMPLDFLYKGSYGTEVMDAIFQFAPIELVESVGLGGIYLLNRYLANIRLKQTEAFFHSFSDDLSYDPLALEMVHGHSTDEARHYTTSFDLGLQLAKSASPGGRRFIKKLMEGRVMKFINAEFRTCNDMISLYEKGTPTEMFQRGVKALTLAMEHPTFANDQRDVRQLVLSWNAKGYGQAQLPLEKKRWRYATQQLQRLIDALDLDLSKGEGIRSYQHFQQALA
jgi:hypothetical protein